MKSIWVLVLSAATVTMVLHVKHQQPVVTPVHHHEFAPAPAATPTPSREIVVAPFNGGEVGARFQSATPDPQGSRRWDN